MGSNRHAVLTDEEVHVPYRQVFANAAARLADATVYTADDLNKKALQSDTLAEYILTSIGPTTWTAISGGGGGGESLAATLAIGNVTGGTDINVSTSDEIVGQTDLVLRSTGASSDIELNPGASGSVTVNGKLTVTGVIDPTAMIFEQNSGTAAATTATQGAIFVSSGAAGLEADRLYYRRADNGAAVGINSDETRDAFGASTLQSVLQSGGSISTTNAPSNVIMKELSLRSVVRGDPNSAQPYFSIDSAFVVDSITIGAGPNLISGHVPFRVFSEAYDTKRAQFNEAISSGTPVNVSILPGAVIPAPPPNQVVEPGAIIEPLVYNVSGTSTPQAKETYLGTTTAYTTATTPTAAFATFTVTNHPMNPGDTFVIDMGPEGGTFTLAGVAGPRGQNQFQVDVGTLTSDIAQNIVEAINDQANSFDNFLVASLVGGPPSSVVRLESYPRGTTGNSMSYSTSLTTPTDISPGSGPLAGGIDSTATLTFAAAPADMNLKRLHLNAPLGTTLDGWSISAIQINAGPNLVTGKLPAPICDLNNGSFSILNIESKSRLAQLVFDIPITSGDVVTVSLVDDRDLVTLVTAGILNAAWLAELV